MFRQAGAMTARSGRLKLLVFAALALVLTACSAGASGPSTSSSTTTSTTSGLPSTSTSSPSTTSTTTTTVPVAVPGTSILRARVTVLLPGALTVPVVLPASPAWLKMVPIAYQTVGSGPDLLLIAGEDGTMSWWGSSLLSALSSHYRVTLFDLPGAGYSGAATARLSLAWLADMTAGFALTVGLSHPIVLGWGLGGEIALRLAERHPGLASSLVLVDTSAGGPGAIQPAKSVERLLSLPSITPSALSKLLFPATGAGLATRTSWESALFVGTTDWFTARTIESQADLQATAWKSSSLSPGLAGVTAPALVVSGTDDIVFPPENARVLVGSLPHATLVELADAGYGAIIEDEPTFVAALETFTGS